MFYSQSTSKNLTKNFFYGLWSPPEIRINTFMKDKIFSEFLKNTTAFKKPIISKIGQKSTFFWVKIPILAY